jgi:hypothetical protein
MQKYIVSLLDIVDIKIDIAIVLGICSLNINDCISNSNCV